LIFQGLDLGEALSAETKLRPTEGGGKYPPEAKSFGKSSAEDVKRREMPPPPVTSCLLTVNQGPPEGVNPKGGDKPFSYITHINSMGWIFWVVGAGFSPARNWCPLVSQRRILHATARQAKPKPRDEINPTGGD